MMFFVVISSRQEASGKVHVAALHFMAIGDRRMAASVYR